MSGNEPIEERIVAGIELGGTKAIAVIGRGRRILERIAIPTKSPDETLGALATQLGEWAETWHPQALGIAAFGPIDVNPASAGYGHMLTTPKAGWAGVEIVERLSAGLGIPCALHTDVTGAAMAEGLWGDCAGLDDFVYVTIGTGIGMGIITNGLPVTGVMHPECGHLRVRRVPGDDFAGHCPYHGDCLEGLASGPAIEARVGSPATDLPPDHPAWPLVADALAEGFASLLLTLSPAAILIGGGVGVGQAHLLPGIRRRIVHKLANYLPGLEDRIATLIRTASLGAEAGPLGALALGHHAIATAG